MYSGCSKPASSAIVSKVKSVSTSSCLIRSNWIRRISCLGDRLRCLRKRFSNAARDMLTF